MCRKKVYQNISPHGYNFHEAEVYGSICYVVITFMLLIHYVTLKTLIFDI